MVRTRHIPALALGALLLSFGLSVASSPNHPPLVDSIRPLAWTSANLYTGRNERMNHCTIGYINAEQQYWLTAAHCVGEVDPNSDSGSTRIAARDYQVDGHLLNVELADFDADIAILQSADGYGIAPLRLAKSNPWWSNHVSMVGYPLGVGPLYSEGYISNPHLQFEGYAGWYAMYNMAGCPGNSGTPAVNARGEVFSVVQFTLGTAPGCSSLLGGTTLDTLQRVAGPYFGR